MTNKKESLLKKGLFASLVACMFSLQTSAQTFNAPMAYEDTHPGFSSGIGLTSHTSAYSWQWINTSMYGGCELVLAGWDDISPAEPAGVSWRLLQPGNPSGIYAEGVIPYGNVRDVEVGWLDVGGDPQILVAYYRNGVGHRIDVYSIATGAPSFLYTHILSSLTTHTRISIDCHKSYAMAVAWHDKFGINTVVGLNTNPISFSPPILLNGTKGEQDVDLAFSHAGPLNMQYVYYNPTTGNMTESAYDFFTALPLPPGSVVNPTINDVNLVGTCRKPISDNIPRIKVCPYPNIDCPGHHNVENWAYTYTTDYQNISVRMIDLNSGPAAFTRVVNNATAPWPQTPTSWNRNMHPFCAYDGHCGPRNLTVAWYTDTWDYQTGTQAGYVALQMDQSGTALVSAPDYLRVANNPTFTSPTPVLSISKEDDAFQYQYTVFPEVDGGGFFQLQHKYPPFCSNSYKGEAIPEHVCNDADKIAAFVASRNIASATIKAHPNPFTNSLVLSIPADYQQGQAEVIVTSILGTVAGKYSGAANEASAFMTDLGKKLTPGTYMVSVDIKGHTKEVIKVVKTQ